MKMYYYIPTQLVETVAFLVARSTVKGKNAVKFKEFNDSLKNVSTRPYYQIDDKIVRFVAGVFNETVIPASYSALYLEAISTFCRPLKELPPEHQEKVRAAAETAKQVMKQVPQMKASVDAGPVGVK